MKFFKEFFYFLATIILMFFFIEIFFYSSELAQTSSTDFSDKYGRIKRKNKQFVFFNEGFGITNYNNFGFIGKSINFSKSNKDTRIAILGDSFIESLQVFPRDNFIEILNSKLNYKKLNYHFLNFGRSGFGLQDMFIYHKNFINKFSPDFIFYFISNEDFTSISKDNLLPKIKFNNNNYEIVFNFDKNKVKSYKFAKILLQNSSILNLINASRKRLANDFNSIVFGKLYRNNELKNNKENLNNEKLNENLLNSLNLLNYLDTNKVIFVNRGKKYLDPEIVKIIKNKKFKYFDLVEDFDKQNSNLYYWKATNKIGHWNKNAHKLIAKRLNEIISKINQNQD